jgi:tetratricopeptide (TPR) repeat protein
MRSTVAVNGAGTPAKPVDAEAMALAAFAEEAPPPMAEVIETPAAKKIQIHCPACDHPFEVDSGMQGKNTRCPECGNVFRVPKILEEKPADWRDAHKQKPSLAKVEEPAPTGAWEDQRKGVSKEAITQAGAEEYEEEEAGERRVRLFKRAFYTLALIGMIVFVVMYFTRSRVDNKREELMAKALAELKEAQVRPQYLAALFRYDAEYQLNNAAKKREAAETARKIFEEARGQLQQLSDKKESPETIVDRNGMLVELALSQTLLGGDLDEINKDLRLQWQSVQSEIRKTLNFITPTEWDLRERGIGLLARKLAEKDQGFQAFQVAKNCSNAAEFPELAGRVGIEQFLAGKKEVAEKVLKEAERISPNAKSPALTALRMALNKDQQQAPTGPRLERPARLGFAEGKALQGDFAEAKKIAHATGAETYDLADALILVAKTAVDAGKTSEAGPILDEVAGIFKSSAATFLSRRPWQLLRVVELSTQAGKTDTANAVLDLMKGNPVEPWARLQVFRVKLAADPKQKSDYTLIEAIDANRLPAALAQAEAARRNTVVGDASYRRLTVEPLAKGTLRPFGYAGIALGEQDRGSK